MSKEVAIACQVDVDSPTSDGYEQDCISCTLFMFIFKKEAMKKLLLATLFASAIVPIWTVKAAQPADAALNCSAIESFGNTFNSALVNQANSRIAGTSYRINRRKTLKIHELRHLDFRGCRVNMTTNVTLKRKIRRDAHGTVKLSADISSVDLAGKKVCYTNARVTDVDLSRTLGIGESVYQWVANRALPNGGCFDL